MEDRRYAATLDRDVNILPYILHSQLTYEHSSGVPNAKGTCIESHQTRAGGYRCIRRSEQITKVQELLAGGIQSPLDEHCSLQ